MSFGWYPIIDKEVCIVCSVCYDFCTHGVYEWDEEEGPIVVQPEGCVHGCHGCENQCPSGAIRYYGDKPVEITEL
jgi:NAD-dependent dihydropyrimidine dehydrogenase PreA subunit